MESMQHDARAPAPGPAAVSPALAALAEFAPRSMLRPGHAFSLAPLSVGLPPPPPPGRHGMPARFLTQLLRYIPVDTGDAQGDVGAPALSTPGVGAPARPPFTTPPSAEPTPADPPVKRRRPVDDGAPPALPPRATVHPLLATWHPLLAPSVAWPSAPMPPRALVLDMVSDAADAALAFIGSVIPPSAYHNSSRRQAAPASPGDAEGAEAMLALLRGDGGASDEEKSDDDAEQEEEEEEEDGGEPFQLVPSQSQTHQCSACGTHESPMWRKHPASRTSLCNACGLRVMRGRPPLTPGAAPQSPRRLFHAAHTPQTQPRKRRASSSGRVFLGRAPEAAAAELNGDDAAEGAGTPGETLRRQSRGWRPNPKFYGEDMQ